MKDSNSLEDIAMEVYLGFFRDLQVAYPQLDQRRDLLRLRSQFRTRGLGFLTLDLPNIDKMLLRGLEDGHLQPNGPLSKVVSKKVRVPRFLSGLWLMVFDNCGYLRDDADVNAILFLRQISVFGKKIVQKCSPKAVKLAIEEFYGIDASLRPIEFYWLDWEDQLGSPSHLSFLDSLADSTSPLLDAEGRQLASDIANLEQVCDLISCELGYYDPYDFVSKGHTSSPTGYEGPRALKHGPGAVSDQRSGDNPYGFPSWPLVLQNRFPFDAFGSYDFSCDLMPDKDIDPSKIIDVPKTADKPRLIASEPTCNRWTQQITRLWLDERLTNTWVGKFIDLHDQNKSAKMVSEASLSGHLCTVDLSSASDRLSAWCVLRAFRKNPELLGYLRAHRTVYTRDTYQIRRKPTIINKFATQGTAVTFPVQSIFFLACALAVSVEKVSRKSILSMAGSVRTFGDDIILPSDGYERLCNLLDYLGLKVNKDKSFHRGSFRESCGMDAWNGFDITPCKPKLLSPSGPEEYSSVIDTCSNLFRKGFWHASKALEESTLKGRELPIISVSSGVAGLLSFCGDKADHLKKRWNARLHRWEWRVHRLKAEVSYREHTTNAGIFQYFTERPKPETNWSSGYGHRGKPKFRLGWEPDLESSVTTPQPLAGVGSGSELR